MSSLKWLEDEVRQRQMMAIGLGVVGAASVLGASIYLIRRQIQTGDVLQVRVVHEVEPQTKRLLDALRPTIEQAVSEGVGVNVRLFPRRPTG